MATVQEIKDKILLGKAYYLELLEQYTIDDQDGCKSCKPDKLSEIGTSIGELEYRIANDIIDDDVQKLYACFLKLISSYSGMSLPVDPNAIIPGINYDVTIITDGKPDWLDVFWTNMTNDVSGYRDTYFNAEWIGLNPMIQIPGVVQYYVDTDYTNDGQGTIVFKPGKGFFSGGTFRAGNYQVYSPPVTTFTYKLINISAIDTEYTLESVISPLIAGQTIENPIVLGVGISADIQDGQTCTYTIYDGNGGVVFTETIIGSASVNGLPMQAERSQEFLFFDSDNPPNLWIDTDTWNDTNTWTD